jgi:hypothetical protein
VPPTPTALVPSLPMTFLGGEILEKFRLLEGALVSSRVQVSQKKTPLTKVSKLLFLACG